MLLQVTTVLNIIFPPRDYILTIYQGCSFKEYRLTQVTSVYYRLVEMNTGYYRLLQAATGCYWLLKADLSSRQVTKDQTVYCKLLFNHLLGVLLRRIPSFGDKNEFIFSRCQFNFFNFFKLILISLTKKVLCWGKKVHYYSLLLIICTLHFFLYGWVSNKHF